MRFFKRLLHRRRLDRDLDEELRFHLEMSGNPRGFGNATQIKEVCRDMWSFVFLESMWQDFRYALRMLAKSPGVTTAAIAALALGIGANTTVYTIVSKALNFNIGIDHPERLVLIEIDRAHMAQTFEESVRSAGVAVQVKSLDLIGAFRYGPVNLSASGALPDRYLCFEISASGFQIIGRAPMLGRVFTPEDERTGAPVLMLSHGVWQDRFGGDPSVIGKTVRIDEVPAYDCRRDASPACGSRKIHRCGFPFRWPQARDLRC